MVTILFAAPSLQASSLSESQLSQSDNDFFEKKVRPLLVEKCLDCHSADERGGGLSLGHRNSLLEGGDSGAAIDLDDPAGSLLMRAVGYEDEFIKMPPDGKLSGQEVEILSAWIQRGAPDPRPEEELETLSMGMSVEDGREFWSFRPISNPIIPNTAKESSNGVITDDWCRNPIDRFVYSEMTGRELTPAPEASRRDWLRRVYWDLVGLPPTFDDIVAFCDDPDEDAYEKVVDRLLNSPQYGVRWGRHWLDTVRYSDSNGLDENLAFGNAWRYRDYVIDSWNQNKPFDRFLQEQIAGDLLKDRSRESHIGTGFLVLGAKVLAEPDKEKLVADTIDEQIDTVGKVFLGLTLGCVRCHDHKFDPVLQSDYYSLSAIFQSTKTFGDSNTGAIKHWREVSFADSVEQESMKSVQQALSAKQGAYNQAKGTAIADLRTRVRSQVVDYLTACMSLPKESLLSDCLSVAQERGLHPRVLLQCRTYLDRFSDSRLFSYWTECFDKEDVESMQSYYSKAFDPDSDFDASLKQEAAAALADVTGFLAIPAKLEHALSPTQVEEISRLAEEARVYESSAPDDSSFMAVVDGSIHETVPIHIRGNHRSPGGLVPKSFPVVFVSNANSVVFTRQQSGRLELAQWLTSPSHPLTARVFVNRLWRWHFGDGIVRTTENFGVLGDEPSHPELLDFLAREFIATEWDVKAMQRMIVLSATYRQSSAHPRATEYAEIDPENRKLWKYSMRRLDAEQIRDGILQSFQELDFQLGGKTVPLRNRQFVFDHTSIDHTKYDLPRRTGYFPIIRNNLAPLLRLFDYPDPTMPTGSRATTSVAPQALLLMNDPWVLDASVAAAERVIRSTDNLETRVVSIFQATLGRVPDRREVDLVLDYTAAELEHISEDFEGDGAALECEVWGRVMQNLVISNEFFFIR